jgi:3,4-dihydroxy-2-butanone 4-phosphate synthase
MGFEFSPIGDALEVIRQGQMVVVADDADRENEGDLIMAAEAATPDRLAFIIRHTSGLVCVALPAERLDELQLPLMVPDNSESMRTAFTVSVDYRHGTTTGISAADRAATSCALVDGSSTAGDFNRPGHIFPLRAVQYGTLRRRGHTEAAVDLTRLAGLRPGGGLCEIINKDGSMARGVQLKRFATRHGLLAITIADLVAYRLRTEPMVRRVCEQRVDTAFGHRTAVTSDSAFRQHAPVVAQGLPGTERLGVVPREVRAAPQGTRHPLARRTTV